MVDLDLTHQVEPHYCKESETWEPLAILPFLDPEHSTSSFYRAFYFPGPSDLHNSYGDYCLLRRVKRN